MRVTARAASLSPQPPQAAISDDGMFNGLVDAAGNSLDGNKQDGAQGSPTDDFRFAFTTTAEVNDTVPKVLSVGPQILEGNVNVDVPVRYVFDIPMQISTLNTSHIQLWPNPKYPFWFYTRADDLDQNQKVVGTFPTMVGEKDVNLVPKFTGVDVNHPRLVSPQDTQGLGWDYYPLATSGAKSAYQICMLPGEDAGAITDAFGSASTCNATRNPDLSDARYCCNGRPQTTQCSTIDKGTTPGYVLPPTP